MSHILSVLPYLHQSDILTASMMTRRRVFQYSQVRQFFHRSSPTCDYSNNIQHTYPKDAKEYPPNYIQKACLKEAEEWASRKIKYFSEHLELELFYFAKVIVTIVKEYAKPSVIMFYRSIGPLYNLNGMNTVTSYIPEIRQKYIIEQPQVPEGVEECSITTKTEYLSEKCNGLFYYKDSPSGKMYSYYDEGIKIDSFETQVEYELFKKTYEIIKKRQINPKYIILYPTYLSNIEPKNQIETRAIKGLIYKHIAFYNFDPIKRYRASINSNKKDIKYIPFDIDRNYSSDFRMEDNLAISVYENWFRYMFQNKNDNKLKTYSSTIQPRT